jgi:diguanylate cyclase (GGDEF)-like protein
VWNRFGRWRFEHQVLLLVGMLCVTLVGVTTGGALWIGRRDQVRLISQDMTETATAMAVALDSKMFERYREISILSDLGPLRRIWSSEPAEARRVLNALQASLPAYAWIGFATPDGTVRAATQGMLEGMSVAARPWFAEGLAGPALGDVHEAALLSKVLPRPASGEPFRFVDVSMPVRNKEGAIIGVLGAHLSWMWAADLREQLLAYSAPENETEIWILDRNGTVLLGPNTGSQPFDRDRLKAMAEAKRGVFEDAQGSAFILTGFAETAGYRDYPGQGWTVIARRPVEVAFAAVRKSVNAVLLLASLVALFGIALACFLARRATAPIRHLTLAAAELGRDGNTSMLPRVEGSREVTELSASLRALLWRVGTAEHALTESEERSTHDALAFQQEIEALKRIADTDPLTGLMNRRAFLTFAEDALVYYRRYRRSIAILVVDIDHFKRVNDSFGHASGDDVICNISQLLTNAVRTTDRVARFGGEEFVILLREVDKAGVEILCDRILAEVRGSVVQSGGHAIGVTISIGAALVSTADKNVQALFERADEALYAAKRRGRNCVRFAGEAQLRVVAAA